MKFVFDGKPMALMSINTNRHKSTQFIPLSTILFRDFSGPQYVGKLLELRDFPVQS